MHILPKTFLSVSILVTYQFMVAPVVNAHGTADGGHCYNGWHLLDGRCHNPHSQQPEKREVQRFIKNGGHCYNDWYLDRKTGKCQKNLGWLESEDDTIELN